MTKKETMLCSVNTTEISEVLQSCSVSLPLLPSLFLFRISLRIVIQGVGAPSKIITAY